MIPHLAFALLLAGQSTAPGPDQWPTYGGAPGGTRYSPARQITRDNVRRLEVAWMYRTGELGIGARDSAKITFEATPLFVNGTLYLSTAFGKVMALDPVTGGERWHFDTGVSRSRRFSEVTSRGVSAWRDLAAAPDAICAIRIFAATINARLHALDAKTGTRCPGFGESGWVDLGAGVGMSRSIDYNPTSPPAVLGDLVIVGSAIGDNFNAFTGDGAVRAFDARRGTERWRWNPVPPLADGSRVGAANAWAVLSVDSTRDLVFVPTSSPSPDFFGGRRPGDNRWGNSVVALKGSTGELVWGFQTVHHDLWDYDNAAQPVLVTVRQNGRERAAVAQPTKTGSLFLLDRSTGEPLFPVEERPVPPSRVPGESAWPTQPFPTLPRPLMPQGRLRPEDA
ncbi:MAG TPA: PQQ-binding-like beta-propeller repeat protein, partial [Gemmatimonadales bacterium]